MVLGEIKELCAWSFKKSHAQMANVSRFLPCTFFRGSLGEQMYTQTSIQLGYYINQAHSKTKEILSLFDLTLYSPLGDVASTGTVVFFLKCVLAAILKITPYKAPRKDLQKSSLYVLQGGFNLSQEGGLNNCPHPPLALSLNSHIVVNREKMALALDLDEVLSLFNPLQIGTGKPRGGHGLYCAHHTTDDRS